MASEEEDLLEEARKAFKLADDAENENRDRWLEDVRFARIGGDEQWPEYARENRRGKPMLTVNKMPAFIRQVVNDIRQNRPSQKVHPVDDKGDPDTAEVIGGLVRNIEYTSDADIAYDTAAEHAVCGGFGYFAIDLEEAHDDTFDLDIKIRRILNPLTISGDPDGMSADGSDWNSAFELSFLHKDKFEDAYPEAERVDWEMDFRDFPEWLDGDYVRLAKWWKREEVERTICRLSDGTVVNKEKIGKEYFLLEGVEVVEERRVKSYRVTSRLMTGAEILTDEYGDKERKWPGIYIPIVPVYGDEFYVEDKRYFYSLIRHAKDPQRNYNYWTTTATELVALAPRVPWLVEEGSTEVDPNWETANTGNHSYLKYKKGTQLPQRQPLDSGPAAGALQQALVSSDEIKATLGMFDASLGNKSNETSGRAILARQREGDISTFHFADNLRRSMRHAGRILIDLIPAVYSKERVIRVIGEDGSQRTLPLGQPVPVIDKQTGQPQMQQAQNQVTGQPMMVPMTRVYDLAAGKYDLTVSSGPSFTTRREEAANQMIEFVRAQPNLLPIIGDFLFKSLDWQYADDIAERMKRMLPPQAQGQNPEMQKIIEQAKQAVGQLQEKLKGMEQENAELKLRLEGERQSTQVDMLRAQIEDFKARTDRFEAVVDAMQAGQPQMANGEIPV